MNKKQLTLIGFRLARGGLALLVTGIAAAQGQPSPAGNPLDTLPVPKLESFEQTGGQIQAPPEQPDDILVQELVPRQFDIEGVRTLEFAKVAREFAHLVGHSVTVAEIVETANRITARYKEAGYALSYAFVPEQNFHNGVVRIVIVEGYIGDLQISGATGKSEALLREMAEPLLAERPLRSVTFERQTQLMTRLPGVRVRASAPAPTTTDGRTALQLDVQHEPYTASVGVSLRQAISRPVASAIVNDPFFGGDQLQLSTILRPWNKERLFTADYRAVLDARGNALRLAYSDYRGVDQQIPVTSGVRTVVEQRRLDAAVSHPWRLSANKAAIAEVGFYMVDYKRVDSVPTTGEWLDQAQRTGAVYAKIDWSRWDSLFSHSLSAMLVQGIDGAGARTRRTHSSNAPIGSDPARLDFTRLAFDLAARHRLPGSDWGGAVTLGGQVSPDILPTTERISFGGSHFGRAYPSGQIAGDGGLGVGVELNRTFATSAAWLKHWDPYLLLESARTWERASEFQGARIRSASLGLRFGDRRHYIADFAVSKPLDRTIANPRRAVRFSLELTYNFSDI